MMCVLINDNVLCLLSGYLLFKDYCENVREESIPQLKFYEEVSVLNERMLNLFYRRF